MYKKPGRRGRPRREEAAPEAALQAAIWRRQRIPSREIIVNLPGLPHDPWERKFAQTQLGVRGGMTPLSDQFWARKAKRYGDTGEGLLQSGRWKIVFENTIRTGVAKVSPVTGQPEEPHWGPPMRYCAFERD